MEGIRVGIVGTGFAASSHIEALRRNPRVQVAAIAASSLDKAEAAARRHGIDVPLEDYRRLLQDDSIDAVHNCTPNHLHAEINHAALEAGKHVLSEKPLALDTSETSELVATAAAAGVVAGVCFNYRHYPLVRHARETIISGRHGRVHFVHGAYLQDWLLREDDWNWRLEVERAGASRAIADIGSHWIDLVQYVTDDEVAEVFAELVTLHAERWRPVQEVATFSRGNALERTRARVDTEDFGAVALRFSGGARGALNVSQVSAGRKNKLTWQIDAEHAALAWDQEEPNRLWVGRRDEPNTEVVRDPAVLAPAAAALAHYPPGHQEGWPDGLKNMLIDFYEAVAAHSAGERFEPSFATFDDAHGVTCVVEAIVASSRAGSWAAVARGPKVNA